MSDQLSLDLTVPAVRTYSCCGRPAPPLYEPDGYDYPHAADCPNPNIGPDGWFDHRNRQIRRLHCIRADGTCPTGGRYVIKNDRRQVDPYDGKCCLELVKRDHEEEHDRGEREGVPSKRLKGP